MNEGERTDSGHRQQCGEVPGGRRGGWGWIEVGKGGKSGTSVIVSTI